MPNNNILDHHLLEDKSDSINKLILKVWQQALAVLLLYLVPYLLIRYGCRGWSIPQLTPVGDLLLQGILVGVLGNIALVIVQTIQQKRIPFIDIQIIFEQNIKTSLLVGILVGVAIRLIALVILMILTSTLGLSNIEKFFADFFIIDIIIAIIDGAILFFYIHKQIKALA